MIPTPPYPRLGSAEAPSLALVERGQQDGTLQRDDGAPIRRRTPTASPLLPGGLLAYLSSLR